jgi:SAM-dependent methyltransferase
MYEVNPYPRWRTLNRYTPTPWLDTYRQLCPEQPAPTWPTPVPVLVAGAGTGRHPLEVAASRPDAELLAVDLSLPSLAYGARMARQLDIRNVRFAQADILALDTLDQRFAVIECAGVLHHLKDPMAGWRVLRRLIRDDGLMKIGLYSERARASIVAARKLIGGTRVPATAEGIQLARRLILSLPPDHPAAGVRTLIDFFSLSGFRDLTMHVQEHRFTIPRLAASLDELGLIFLGFHLDPAVLARFRARFPQPGSELDLACWDIFEAETPDTFVAMYQFWCRPR